MEKVGYVKKAYTLSQLETVHVVKHDLIEIAKKGPYQKGLGTN